MSLQISQEVLERKVLSEQLAALYSALPLSIVATLINASIIFYILYQKINHFVLFVWTGILLLSVLVRLFSFFFFKFNRIGKLQNSVKLFDLGTSFTAIAWLLVSLILFIPNAIAYNMFLVFVIAGMSAGAVTSLSYRKYPIYIFLSASLIPLMIRLSIEHGNLYHPMAIMVLIFFLMMLTTANRFYTRFRENILFRLEADLNAKTIRERETNLRAIFEAAPVGILQFDTSASVLSGNKNADRLLAYDKDTLLHTCLFDLIEEKSFNSAITEALQGKFSQYTGQVKTRKPDNQLPIRIYFKGLIDQQGEISGGVAIVEDISEQVRMEQIKSEFISTVSHELRTPLTAINGSIGLLETAPVESRNQLIDIMKRNTSRLILLINDLLDMEKILSGNMRFDYQFWEVNHLLERAVEEMQGFAKEHNTHIVTYLLHEEIKISVDKQRFKQVMANLISNACKFTRENTEVSVSVQLIEGPNRKVAFSVQDHGQGIPDDFADKIFSRFSQADSSNTRKVGGTGLGLYISKQIVVTMGGVISFENNVAGGATFTVIFPVAD